ncbi:hypothetical protein GEU84_001180 [Fertoebacter nigrum]|uniref:Uncharacterized protein n=1 Tax=Fertoeibacter niger TaxID=2656921 RepID=A0A8X8GRG6_9RHOB|nr:hypothetical protein [Fertoeibacter niger]NUB42984.1 hypothetical protein [Fertoeibacter niger]
MPPNIIDTCNLGKSKSLASERVAEWTKQKKSQGYRLAKVWLLPEERELILNLVSELKALRPEVKP